MAAKHTLVISFNQDNEKATDADIHNIVEAASTSIRNQKNLDRSDVDILFSAQESPLARGFAEAFLKQWQEDDSCSFTLSQEVTHTTRTKAGQWRPGYGTEMGLLYYQSKNTHRDTFTTDKIINTSNSNKGILSINTTDTGDTKIKFCGAHLESRQPYQRVTNISDWFHRHMAPEGFLSFEQISDLAVDNIILAGDMNTRATYSVSPKTITSYPNHLILPDRQTATHKALQTIGLKQHQLDSHITYPVKKGAMSSWKQADLKRRQNNECKGGDLDHIWCHDQSVARTVVETESSDHEAVVTLVKTTTTNTPFERTKQFIARVLSGMASNDVLTTIKKFKEQQNTDYLTNVYFYYTMIIKLNLQKLSLQSRGHYDESRSLQLLVTDLQNHCNQQFITTSTPDQSFLQGMKNLITTHQSQYKDKYQTHRHSTRYSAVLNTLNILLLFITASISKRVYGFFAKTKTTQQLEKTTQQLDLFNQQLTSAKKSRSHSISANFFSQKNPSKNGTFPRHQSSSALLKAS